LFRWIYQHSIAAPRGMFAISFAASPRGAENLDDLPLYDATDSNHVLLVIVVPTANDLIAYRKLVPIAN
jgi:hypothetical protein